MQYRFNPAWWLPNPHLQTLWSSLVPRKMPKQVDWERLELPDGDFLDLSWVGNKKGPIILILHGLNGNIHSTYAKGILKAIDKRGWRGMLMHFRGCSGVPNRLARGYHSGDTHDLQYVVKELIRREPATPIFAVGYSLGGNVLLKWLGESGIENPLRAAIAVSVPFELQKTANRLNRGFSRLYQWKLLRELHIAQTRKLKKKINKHRTFWEFDNKVTAPLHGFKNAEDYYEQSSSRQYLCGIQVPTLILHARDDPFTELDALPDIDEVSSNVSLELTDNGGHVGFVTGKYPWRPIYWLEERIVKYIEDILNAKKEITKIHGHYHE